MNGVYSPDRRNCFDYQTTVEVFKLLGMLCKRTAPNSVALSLKCSFKSPYKYLLLPRERELHGVAADPQLLHANISGNFQ